MSASAISGGSVTSSISTTIKAQSPQQGSGTGLAPLSISQPVPSGQLALGFGTNAGNANLFFVAQYNLAASGTQTLDFYSGLNDPFGNSLAFLHLKWLAYSMTGGDATGITRAGAMTHPFLGDLGGTTPTQTIYPTGPGYSNGETSVGWTISSTVNSITFTNNSSTVAAVLTVGAAGTTT
jgi:hypothetical protein